MAEQETARIKLETIFKDMRNRQHWFELGDLAKHCKCAESTVEETMRDLRRLGYDVQRIRQERKIFFRASKPYDEKGKGP